jgi:hypothetical protein
VPDPTPAASLRLPYNGLAFVRSNNRALANAPVTREETFVNRTILRSVTVAAGVLALATTASAQTDHVHALRVNGVPGGLPVFCASPTVVAVGDGAWSSTSTWSTGRIPGAADRVAIPAGRAVSYDVVSDAVLPCVEVTGRLAFDPAVNTRMKVVNLTVMDQGALEVGTTARPIGAGVKAEIVIADERFDSTLDPGQVGNGVEALGRVTMHGAPRTPTFARLGEEALAGQATLLLAEAATGWMPGDRIVIPDTRQLRDNERGSTFKPQDETLEIAAVSGMTVTLTAALQHDHRGTHGADSRPAFLPHVGNLSRNVVVRSENARGTRGHMIFMYRADVDLRYVEVRDMGRTTLDPIDNTVVGSDGQVVRIGANQIGRYAIHFHHTFGPKKAGAGNRQFTLIGNAVSAPAKWGITVHNSHYGLVQDNIVYGAHGAAIVTEDGTESFNVFDHNFAVRAEGAGDRAPRGGYGGSGPDPGSDGSGFWFQGPNNYIRNNVAANAESSGFNLAGRLLGTVRIPSFQSADTSLTAETKPVDAMVAPVLEFANNEAYGAMLNGIECGWNGVITNFRAWHIARYGLMGAPNDRMVIDGLVVRGDAAILADEHEEPAGAWIGNYSSKQIVVRNADIAGVRTGILSPFFSGAVGVGGSTSEGSLLVENSRFKNYIGVVVGTGYTGFSRDRGARKTATVRGSTFEPLPDVPATTARPPAAISMNYQMASGDAEPRDPIQVLDFNKKAGDSFKVYYSLDAPAKSAPCHESRRDLDGWVCK